MLLARRPTAPLAVLAGLLAAAACGKRVDDYDVASVRDPQTAREKCRAAFAACAPAVRFGADTKVKELDRRWLVHLASRLDVDDKLAANAAKELVTMASTADGDTLLDLQDTIDNTRYSLGKCACDGFLPEIEKQGVAALVARRAPARETRSPEHWADRLLAQLREINALSRRGAELAVGGDPAAVAEVGARRRKAERELCETAHAARQGLPPQVYASCLQIVYEKRAHDAGQGSAEVARRTLTKYERAATCDVAEP